MMRKLKLWDIFPEVSKMLNEDILSMTSKCLVFITASNKLICFSLYHYIFLLNTCNASYE